VCAAALRKIAMPLVVMKTTIHRKGLHETIVCSVPAAGAHRNTLAGRIPNLSYVFPLKFLCFSFEIWTMATASNRGLLSFPLTRGKGWCELHGCFEIFSRRAGRE
jgi:hypothetical protein